METQQVEQEPRTQYSIGDVVEGSVIAVDRSVVYIDLSPIGTGIIYGREFAVVKDILRKIKPHDTISAQVIDPSTPDGYIDLSLKEARKAFVWNEAKEAMENKTVQEVTIKSANYGGLVIEWNGIRGFLPASQLTEQHYPKVLNGNKEGILNELKKLVGEKLSVIIENIEPENDVLIFSEHKSEQSADGAKEKDGGVSYSVGDIKSGVVSGVVDFGVFVTVNNAIEGLVHISEMDWGLVDDPRRFYSIGNQVQVKIIAIEDGKYSFSFKELHKNPWEDILSHHKVGDTVSGVVIKYEQFGAFASIKAGVSGLVHISNFADDDDLRNSLEIGKTYEFVITNLEPKEQKLTLVPKDRYGKRPPRSAKKESGGDQPSSRSPQETNGEAPSR